MELWFEIGGRVALAVRDVEQRAARYVRSQMDPYAALHAGTDPDVVLVPRAGSPPSFVDVQNAANDSTVTASDGRRLFVVDGGRSCTVPDPAETPVRLEYDLGFPLSRVFGAFLRPALQIALLDRDAAAIHAASVAVDGEGIVIAGWSETGKTETALAFLEEGARFVSDKWTVVGSDETIACFPITVGVRRWVLRYLPRLREALPARARAQLAAAAAAAAASRPLRPLRTVGRVGGLAVDTIERAVALGDRAALLPSEVRRAYDDPARDPESWTAPFGATVVLTTVPGPAVTARPADPTWAARRLARSATYERRRFFELHQRARYALPDRDGPRWEVEAREERFLASALAERPLLEVRAPFPVDPRRVVEAVHRAL